MITKAIIPVAGWGIRRLPITKIIEKSMLPVGNRPLVDYSVQELIKAGVKDIFANFPNFIGRILWHRHQESADNC